MGILDPAWFGTTPYRTSQRRPYYVQKMLFSDNQGTRVLPFTQNTAHCHWSASMDTESGKRDVLLKVVNKSDSGESVNITLIHGGNVNPAGHATTLVGVPAAENSLAKPNISPVSGDIRCRR